MNYFNITLILLSILLGTINCCSNNEDCTSITDSTCTEGKCTCQTGYFINSDSTACIPYVTEYYGECSEDSQCEWLGENSVCNYVCTCKEGFRWYLGQCKKYVGLGDDCQDSIDCFDGYNLKSLICSNGKCQCSDGYYPRGDTDCRKIASKVNDTCALDIDCKFENSLCTLGKCQTNSSKSLLKELEEIEEDSFSYKRKIALTTCKTSDDCKIKNSECYDKTGKCICKKSYFFNEDGTECIPELGVDAECVQDSDCKIRPGKCENGICYCRDYYFVDSGNRNCVKTISQNNWNCLSKEWCYALGRYSYCSSSETCKCSKIADLDEEDLICKWNGQDDSGMCFNDNECKYIDGGYCIDEACGCKGDHFVHDNKCFPSIGAQCDDSNPCVMDNSICNGTCKCLENYVSSVHKDTCYLISHKLGTECEEDVQCSTGILYTKCLNKTCQCDDEYSPYKNKCYQKKEKFSHCNTGLECTISLGETFVCRNAMCQCPTYHSMEGNECSSSSMRSVNLILIIFVLILKNIQIFG